MRLRNASRVGWAFASLVAVAACGDDGEVDGPTEIPYGSLRVSWNVVDEAGVAQDCEALGFTSAEIAIGGAPRSVACNAAPQVFDRLLPDRYPVFVRMQVSNVDIQEERTNAVVVAGEEAQANLTFVVATEATGPGSLHVRWVVGGDLASRGCGVLGAATMSLRSGAGGRSEFGVDVPCIDGEASLTGILPGRYEVIARLLDAQGRMIVTNTIPTVLVKAGEVAEPAILDMVVPSASLGTILGLWTVTGTTAATGCAANIAGRVEMRLVQRIETGTSTACERGAVRLGRVREESNLSVEFVLFAPEDPLSGIEPVMTSTIVEHVAVRNGRTTTVAVDLRP